MSFKFHGVILKICQAFFLDLKTLYFTLTHLFVYSFEYKLELKKYIFVCKHGIEIERG